MTMQYLIDHCLTLPTAYEDYPLIKPKARKRRHDI